jgi:hypothetical protein
VQVELGPSAAARPDRRVTLEKNAPALLSDNVNLPLERPLRDPDFLYAALDTTACAAFIKERRMKCINANQLHRKSGSTRCSRIE